MTFICGIHEGNKKGGGQAQGALCKKQFPSLAELIEHVKAEHNTVLGKGRRKL